MSSVRVISLTLLVILSCTSRSEWAVAQQQAPAAVVVVPCDSAPVSGLPFARCTRTPQNLGNGSVLVWNLYFSDNVSESHVKYLRADTAGTIPHFPQESTAEMFRGNMFTEAQRVGLAFSNVEVHEIETYFDFQMGNRHCKGLRRDGLTAAKVVESLTLARFCRQSDRPIPTNEARYLIGGLVFK